MNVYDIGEDSEKWLVSGTEDEYEAMCTLGHYIISNQGLNEDTILLLKNIVDDADLVFRLDWAWQSRVPSFNYEDGVDLDEAWLRHGGEVPDDEQRFPRFAGFLISL